MLFLPPPYPTSRPNNIFRTPAQKNLHTPILFGWNTKFAQNSQTNPSLILIVLPAFLLWNLSAPICSTSCRSHHFLKRFTYLQALWKIAPWCSRHVILLTVPSSQEFVVLCDENRCTCTHRNLKSLSISAHACLKRLTSMESVHVSQMLTRTFASSRAI